MKTSPYTGRARKRRCRVCGYRSNSVGAVEGATRPQPGDLVLCINCAEPSIVAAGGAYREPTKEERKDLANSADVAHAVAAILKLDPERG